MSASQRGRCADTGGNDQTLEPWLTRLTVSCRHAPQWSWETWSWSLYGCVLEETTWSSPSPTASKGKGLFSCPRIERVDPVLVRISVWFGPRTGVRSKSMHGRARFAMLAGKQIWNYNSTRTQKLVLGRWSSALRCYDKFPFGGPYTDLELFCRVYAKIGWNCRTIMDRSGELVKFCE